MAPTLSPTTVLGAGWRDDAETAAEHEAMTLRVAALQTDIEAMRLLLGSYGLTEEQIATGLVMHRRGS